MKKNCVFVSEQLERWSKIANIQPDGMMHSETYGMTISFTEDIFHFIGSISAKRIKIVIKIAFDKGRGNDF